MIPKFVSWLFSPETKAKKRTIIVLLGSLAGGILAAAPLVDFMCGDSLSMVCSVNLVLISDLVNKLSILISSPEMGGVAFLTGLYSIISGYRRDAKETEQKNG